MVYFKFNTFSGRISQGTPSAYVPQGLQASIADPTNFKFDSVTTKPVAPSAGSAAAALGEGKGVVPRVSGYQNIRNLQTAWAVQDGLLVWQKRGMRDALPRWITFGLMFAGLGLCTVNLVKMSFPPQTEE